MALLLLARLGESEVLASASAARSSRDKFILSLEVDHIIKMTLVGAVFVL